MAIEYDPSENPTTGIPFSNGEEEAGLINKKSEGGAYTNESVGEYATARSAANDARASANDAAESENNASSSAVSAANSAASAAASETSAILNASNAADAAANASLSQSNANISAESALTSANLAAGSASSSSQSAQQASLSSSAAQDSEIASATSAANAATSEANAAISESNAATSETNAGLSASEAATSATNAGISEANAATYEGQAAASKVASEQAQAAAELAKTLAENAQSATENLFDQFGDQYLGSHESDPVVDNDGDPLTDGDIYWNSVDSVLKFYTGTAWTAPEVISTTAAANALVSETNAATSAANSATSETNAATSEANAATSEANALTSANNAATSATASATSATESANSSAASATSATESANSAASSALSATSSATSASESASSATASATSATASFNSAESSATSATESATSASEALTSQLAAATSESNAAVSATSAATSETNAASSASSASISATNASNSETNAAISATSSASSATASANSATEAATSEVNAGVSETNASVSATNAAISAASAATSANSAASSESAATSRELAAAASEANAASSATSAASSATAASTSATSASNSASAAATSETNAATSATESDNSATASANSASASATSASASAVSASEAATSETNAIAVQTNLYSVYLGTQLSDPTLDLNGNAVSAGAWYYNTTLDVTRIYNGTEWVNGAVDTSSFVLTDGNGAVSTLQFNGGTGDQGTLSWNSEDETLDLVVSPDVTYQLGQELGIVARNLSGVTLSNGAVVRVTGASGNKITIDLADSSTELNSSSTYAIVTEVIGDNSTGKVTTNGLVRGLDTSAFTEGAAVWLGNNGTFTTTKPSSPDHLVHIGWVVRSHATEGSILVRISNGWEIDELHDVSITDLSDNELLQWNAAASVWENRTISEAGLATSAQGSKADTAFSWGDHNAANYYSASGGTISGSVTTTGDVVIGGNLTVDGTTTTVNAENLSITDNMIYLNDGNTTLNEDLGWSGNYNDGTYAHAGFFRDASDGRFKAFDGYTPEVGNTVDTTHASFSLADIQADNFYGNLVGNAATASTADKWDSARTITLDGDLSGSVSIDGTSNVVLSANINTNSVALGTDTSGDYAGAVIAGSGIAINGTPGEGTTYTVSHEDTSTQASVTNSGNTFIQSIGLDTYGHITSVDSVTVNIPAGYNGWTISDGTNSENVIDGSTVNVVGSGATSTSYNSTTNTLTITSTDTDTVYTHPSYNGDDFSVDTGPLTGATVVSDIDINVTTDTLGHVVDANGVVSTRTLTLGDLGYTGASDANKYVHPTHPGDDINLDTGPLSGATVISDLDFNVTTDTLGHVTDANATYATRNITAADVGAAPASHSHSYLSSVADSEQSGHFGDVQWNQGAVRINSDPRNNESGYDPDLSAIHWWSTTAAGANYGRVGHALYNGSAYQYLTTKSGQNNLYVNNQAIFHEGYHPNADKWTTARTLSLTGDVTGSVSWDGSSDVSITTVVANNSHNHDTLDYDLLTGPSTSSRDKIRVYSSSAYAIGMQSGVTYGGLNDWAMTFQFNNDSDRGFWWGHEGHSTAQGAMSLTTAGHLTVGSRIDVPIMYDLNDTAFYCDPAGQSRFNELQVRGGTRGRIVVGSSSWLDTYDTNRPNITLSGGQYPHLTLDSRTSATNTNHGGVLSFVSALSAGGFRRWSMGTPALDGSALSWGVYDNNANPHYGVGGTLGYTTYGSKMWLDTAGNLQTNNSVRSPIFYDSNDTGYYLDPANNGTSIKVNGDYQTNGGKFIIDRYNETGNTFQLSRIRSSTWPFRFVTEGVGNDNDSGFWVGSNGYPDMRLRRENGTVRALISSWERSYTNFGFTDTQDIRSPIFYDNNNTSYWVNPADGNFSAYLAGTVHADGGFSTEGGSIRIANPGGASYATTASTVTGAIKVTLPMRSSNTMISFEIKVYEYSTSESFTIQVSGYNYSSGWINTSAYIIGQPGKDRNFNVRFSDDGSKRCILIGETTSTWSYPQVAVTNFHGGYSSYGRDTWNNGWSVGFTTALGTVSATHSNVQVGRLSNIWYDRDNTGYYVDPASTSILNDFRCDIMYDKDNTAYYVRPGSTSILNDARANIWYSRSNTAYYSDPESTSRLNAITANKIHCVGSSSNVAPRWDTSFHVAQSQHWYSHYSTDTMYAGESGNTVLVRGTLQETSDKRLKSDIEKIDNAVDKVKQLGGYTYNKVDHDKRATGVIAQEVLAVLPEAVSEGEDGYYSVAYGNMVGLLIEAIKEQQSQIDELKTQLSNMNSL